MAKRQQESHLQKRLRISLQVEFDQKAYSIKVHGDMYSAPGVPDIIASVMGQFVGIECKMWRNRPSEVQQLHIRDINRSEGIGLYLVWNREENVYYWVPADAPFTYRAKAGWVKALPKYTTIGSKKVEIIDCSYLKQLIAIKAFNLTSEDIEDAD